MRGRDPPSCFIAIQWKPNCQKKQITIIHDDAKTMKYIFQLTNGKTMVIFVI